MSRPRFTVRMVIDDAYGMQRPIMRAIGVDEALRISERAVGDLKMTASPGVALISAGDAIQLMKTREMRRDILKQLAVQLAGQIADRLEDAEGWHDASRIKPAREAIGGDWDRS